MSDDYRSRELKEYHERLLDELYVYVSKENKTILTVNESNRYVQIVDILHLANVEIPFGIEI